MKILIVNGYVRENRGDAALLYVLATQLRSVFPDAVVRIASMESPEEHPLFEGFENVGSMRLYSATENIPRFFRFLRKILVISMVMIYPIIPNRLFFLQFLPMGIRRELFSIEEADLVVSASGGYFTGTNSFFGNLNIYYLAGPLRIASRLGKFVVMAPESFGPFGNDWQQSFVRKTLNAVQLILVRENTSYELLKTLGVKEDLLRRAVDSGFAYLVNSNNSQKNSDQIRIGITARNWLKDKQQIRYETVLADFIVYVEKKYNAQVILVPQVTSNFQKDDDRIVEERIKELAMQRGAIPCQITEGIDLRKIKDLYSTFNFTIGTRFHSVIFSLTSYVPAIAIEYEHKTRGIMHDLKLDKWVLKIEDITFEKLIKLFEDLMINKDAYKSQLLSELPGYIEKTNETPYLIKQEYEKSVKSI